MIRVSRKFILSSAFVLVAQSLSACTDYWWERGQAPNSEDLLKRSLERYDSAQALHGARRNDFQPAAQAVNSALEQALVIADKGNALKELRTQLHSCADSFAALEGKLSVGSRAPYGELSGQLRSMVGGLEKGGELSKSTLGLFAARTRFFLANEFAMDQPVTQPIS